MGNAIQSFDLGLAIYCSREVVSSRRSGSAPKMSLIADVSIPADQFDLGRLLEVRSGIQVRLEAMIPTAGMAIPYFWVESSDAEAIEAALRESDVVGDVRALDEVDDETLFRVEWDGEVDGFLASVREAEAAVLDAEGHGDYWSFQLRFPEYDALSAFYRDVVGKDISIDLAAVHNPADTAGSSSIGLTPEQREALSLALEAGYFDVPRGITLVELAEELGISDSAVSQRIRRGLAEILSATIAGESSDQ